MSKLELLAPAGDKESFLLAINNGANAIYVAGKNFGARAYANNFTTDELLDMISYAHTLDVKVYVTVNTLIKNKELNDAISFIEVLYKGGVDAVIIQDIGLASILRKMFPNLNLHASTQMNCLNVNFAKELKDMGFSRIILARETPIEVVKKIIDEVDIEVEVFGHGALCMCYSGNCYLSSVIGKRSGNRGRCAQPCRLPYQLVSDNLDIDKVNKMPKRYYLSPRDLCEIENINSLKEAGVTSLKLEGRMKRSEYVGLITNRYRKAIDKNLDSNTLEHYKDDLAVMFNRSFTKGYLFNEDNKHFTNIATSNHIGIKIGVVSKYQKGYAYIKLDENLNSGDGIRILSKDNDAIIINEMFVNGIKGTSAKKGDLIQIRTHKDIDEKSIVLKTSDASLVKEVNEAKRKPIYLDAKLYLDKDIFLEVSDGINQITIKSDYPFEKAKNPDIKKRQEEQLRKTSDTIYTFRNITINDNMFLPIKEINELRRKAIEAINNIRKGNKDVVINKYVLNDINVYHQDEKKLYFKVKNNSQLEACISLGAKNIIVDSDKLFNEANKYKLLDNDIDISLVDRRINNNGIYNKKIVDVYSNVLNYASVRKYLEEGANVVGLSIEASREDILSTISTYKDIYKENPNVMVMVYGYYELMIMKHCLINKSLGLAKKGCGECSKHQYYLVDKMGYYFPLVNDGACNLKMLNGKRLHLIKQIKEILDMGVNNILVDLSIEDDYEDVISEYLKAMDAYLNNKAFKEEYRFDNVTYGHYNEGVE